MTSRRSSRRSELMNTIEHEKCEWPPEENKFFIPHSIIDALLNEVSVQETFKTEMSENSGQDIRRYTSCVLRSSKILFTIFICMPDLEMSILGKLLDEGIRDRHLPFSRVPKPMYSTSNHNGYRLGKVDHEECSLRDHKDCDIKSLLCLDHPAIRQLCERQWSALAPIFELSSSGVRHYNFAPGTIMPFLDGKALKSGGFGEVWEVRIHPAHQKLWKSGNPEGPLLAIKELLSNNDYERTFKLEVEMLSALNAHSHRHIIRLLATYKLKGKYYLIFPLAHGNLRDHWDAISMPFWNRHTYLWVLEQIVGIVSALEVIHEETGLTPAQPDNPNPGTSNRPFYKEITLRVDPTEAKFGRHGDIKPENVLWMRDSAQDSGSLVIADMGLGRFHRKESRSQVDPKSVNGSPTYAPPEITLNKPVSRAYDIWSLGCVFAEFITWLLKGRDGLVEFGLNRLEMAEDNFSDDTFFSIRTFGSGPRAEIRPGVTKWVRYLSQDERCSELLQNLLETVEHHMLSVDPKSRITAKQLKLKLSSMMRRARSDSFYLLGAGDRPENDAQGIKLPMETVNATLISGVPAIEVNGPSI